MGEESKSGLEATNDCPAGPPPKGAPADPGVLLDGPVIPGPPNALGALLPPKPFESPGAPGAAELTPKAPEAAIALELIVVERRTVIVGGTTAANRPAAIMKLRRSDSAAEVKAGSIFIFDAIYSLRLGSTFHRTAPPILPHKWRISNSDQTLATAPPSFEGT